ncbi:hypothetical protein [Brucella anthropi]|uniref:Uncharacterized protein n=1 Tax=Brucella anthropi TaxID=529 RepID=A0A8I0TC49_BRUAN|nr:hypothetical protein [Brucella anthropi]MBE0564195.1 hypothetical protein [Brucella anthropi]QFP61758.1 hypothetical protein FT787_00865 [Brucella anthropi]
MGHILQHAAEYETVRRLAEMLGTTKEKYRATESYALFSTIVCWVMQRARTTTNGNNPADRQAREVGIALQGSRISAEPWSINTVPEMTAFDFFISVRNAVAHGDGRQISPLNENNILVGQIIPVSGIKVRLYRADMQRLGSELAKIFCDTMEAHEREGRLQEEARKIQPIEDAA